MNNSCEWYSVKDPNRIDSPALLIYPERVIENIELLLSLAGDVSKVRPHVKTNKSPEAVTLMMEAGIKKYKCATIAEAEMLAQCKAPDVLLAYQPTFPKLQRLILLSAKYSETNFSCLVDNFQTAEMISKVATDNDTNIKVYLDLNVGMNRTGITPGNDAIELYEILHELKGIVVGGIHAYDGHINESAFDKRKELCDAAFFEVEEMRSGLHQKGYNLPLLIAGGSPTFQLHCRRKNTECSPGTFIFWDKNYSESIPEQNFLFAALVLTRIVSLPGQTRICIDLGHKSIASENSLDRRAFFLNAKGLKPVSHSEEHMVLEAGEGHCFQVGDVLYALPYHICPSVALYNEAFCVSSGEITGSWNILAGNRKIGI